MVFKASVRRCLGVRVVGISGRPRRLSIPCLSRRSSAAPLPPVLPPVLPHVDVGLHHRTERARGRRRQGLTVEEAEAEGSASG